MHHSNSHENNKSLSRAAHILSNNQPNSESPPISPFCTLKSPLTFVSTSSQQNTSSKESFSALVLSPHYASSIHKQQYSPFSTLNSPSIKILNSLCSSNLTQVSQHDTENRSPNQLLNNFLDVEDKLSPTSHTTSPQMISPASPFLTSSFPFVSSTSAQARAIKSPAKNHVALLCSKKRPIALDLSPPQLTHSISTCIQQPTVALSTATISGFDLETINHNFEVERKHAGLIGGFTNRHNAFVQLPPSNPLQTTYESIQPNEIENKSKPQNNPNQPSSSPTNKPSFHLSNTFATDLAPVVTLAHNDIGHFQHPLQKPPFQAQHSLPPMSIFQQPPPLHKHRTTDLIPTILPNPLNNQRDQLLLKNSLNNSNPSYISSLNPFLPQNQNISTQTSSSSPTIKSNNSNIINNSINDTPFNNQQSKSSTSIFQNSFSKPYQTIDSHHNPHIISPKTSSRSNYSLKTTKTRHATTNPSRTTHLLSTTHSVNSTGQLLNSFLIVAIAEYRSTSRHIGIAAIDLHNPELILSQYVDTQTYTSTLQLLHVLDPKIILFPETTGHVHNILEHIVRSELAFVEVLIIKRKFFNESIGIKSIERLCIPAITTNYNNIIQQKTGNQPSTHPNLYQQNNQHHYPASSSIHPHNISSDHPQSHQTFSNMPSTFPHAMNHFHISSNQDQYLCLSSCGCLIKYIEHTQQILWAPKSIRCTFKRPDGCMYIDLNTINALELVHTNSLLNTTLKNVKNGKKGKVKGSSTTANMRGEKKGLNMDIDNGSFLIADGFSQGNTHYLAKSGATTGLNSSSSLTTNSSASLSSSNTASSVSIPPLLNQPINKTLFGTLNFTKTKGGARTLRYSILNPLHDIISINTRLDCVQTLLNNEEIYFGLTKGLHHFLHLETTCSQLARTNRSLILPQHAFNEVIALISLRKMLLMVGEIADLCRNTQNAMLNSITAHLDSNVPLQIIKCIDSYIQRDYFSTSMTGTQGGAGINTTFSNNHCINHHSTIPQNINANQMLSAQNQPIASDLTRFLLPNEHAVYDNDPSLRIGENENENGFKKESNNPLTHSFQNFSPNLNSSYNIHNETKPMNISDHLYASNLSLKTDFIPSFHSSSTNSTSIFHSPPSTSQSHSKNSLNSQNSIKLPPSTSQSHSKNSLNSQNSIKLPPSTPSLHRSVIFAIHYGMDSRLDDHRAQYIETMNELQQLYNELVTTYMLNSPHTTNHNLNNGNGNQIVDDNFLTSPKISKNGTKRSKINKKLSQSVTKIDPQARNPLFNDLDHDMWDLQRNIPTRNTVASNEPISVASRSSYINQNVKLHYTQSRGYHLLIPCDNIPLDYHPGVFIQRFYKGKYCACTTFTLEAINKHQQELFNDLCLFNSMVIENLITFIKQYMLWLYLLNDHISLLDMLVSFSTYITLNQRMLPISSASMSQIIPLPHHVRFHVDFFDVDEEYQNICFQSQILEYIPFPSKKNQFMKS